MGVEKGKMIVVDYITKVAEDPINIDGYLQVYNNHEIHVVGVGKLIGMSAMAVNSSGAATGIVCKHADQVLRMFRELVKTDSSEKVYQKLVSLNDTKMFGLIAPEFLAAQKLQVALNCYTKCRNYASIQFVKQLIEKSKSNFGGDVKQLAEIYRFLGDYGNAICELKRIDRNDLIIDIHVSKHEWEHVVDLVKTGSAGFGGTDGVLESAYTKLGDNCKHQRDFIQALAYYKLARNYRGVIDVCILANEFGQDLNVDLRELENASTESDLLRLAEYFVSVGMCARAVDIYVKLGDFRTAVETCILFNDWRTEIRLSEGKQEASEITNLISGYKNYLLERGRNDELVLLCRDSGDVLGAADILGKIAESDMKSCKPLKSKKIHVLAALLASTVKPSRGNINKSPTENTWKKAEAWHFYLLANRQLQKSEFRSCVITAKHLQLYVDILGVERVYMLLALASVHAKQYKTCALALQKLKREQVNTEKYDGEEIDVYDDLATRIFLQ